MPKKEDKLILVLNSGSATLKFKIFAGKDFSEQVAGIVEKIGQPGSFVNILEKVSGRMIMKNFPEGVKNHAQALEIVLGNLNHWQEKIKVVGHRIVHGGSEFFDPVEIDGRVLKKLMKNDALAPLHNPINLSCVKYCLENLPKVSNIGVFDTGFYKTLPPKAYIYGIPYQYYQDYNIRRYGFHGISHQYAATQAALAIKKPLNKLKLITCHLGNGCSISAIDKGRAIETSMGFTPLPGLVMGTRCGDLDPSVVLFLIRQFGFNADEVEEILNKKSGLLGLTGKTSDLRDILIASGYEIPGYKPAADLNPKQKKRCKLALDIFIHHIVKYIGAYSAVLGQADYLVFTGGIGERNGDIRNLVISQVKNLMINKKPIVVPANEELMIAMQAAKFNKKS